MLDTVDFNHVQHISFTQSSLTDTVSVIEWITIPPDVVLPFSYIRGRFVYCPLLRVQLIGRGAFGGYGRG